MYIYIYIYIRPEARATQSKLKGQLRSSNLKQVQPVRITRIHVTRLSPRVGLPRSKYLIGT